MRIVGQKNRPEFELDPVEAYRRARALDQLLRHANTSIRRGVFRGTHEYFNRLDALRQVRVARLLNAA